MDAGDPDAAYWTDRWLSDHLPGQAPERLGYPAYHARDLAEVAIVRTPHLPVQGPVREQVLARRAEAQARTGSLDRQIARAFEERQLLSDRVDRCNLALAGLGYRFDRRRGTYRWSGTRPAADPPAIESSGIESSGIESSGIESSAINASRRAGSADVVIELSGAGLCARIEAALHTVGVSVTSGEIQRLVELPGYRVAGRASQTIANALRPALARGSVVKVGRGRYRSAA